VIYKLKSKGSTGGERCSGGWLSLPILPTDEVVVEEFVDELCSNRATQPLNI
jgi:hypothetical protein